MNCCTRSFARFVPIRIAMRQEGRSRHGLAIHDPACFGPKEDLVDLLKVPTATLRRTQGTDDMPFMGGFEGKYAPQLWQ
jgi:hypothetical protein